MAQAAPFNLKKGEMVGGKVCFAYDVQVFLWELENG